MRTEVEGERARQERQVQKALGFRQCPFCSYDLSTGEGERGCHYYDCPYRPELLDVFCPTCRFNFLTKDGDAACAEPPVCSFARTEAPLRVATLKRWVALQARTGPNRTDRPRAGETELP